MHLYIHVHIFLGELFEEDIPAKYGSIGKVGIADYVGGKTEAEHD